MEINRKRVAKRLVSGLVAGALALGGLALSGAAPASAVSAVTTEARIAGADRYATANAVAKLQANVVAGSATTVVIASGENFPDGLAASALAGALSAPLLLTTAESLPTSVLETLTGFGPANSIASVVLIGGESVISATIEAQLEALGYAVTRIAGTDRYTTANAVAAAVKNNNGGAIGTFGGYRTAFLANGNNFPDALAASSWAYKNKHPLFLTNGTSLSAETIAAMTAAGVQQVIILGGESAVSAEVATAVAGVTGVITSTRVTGDTRYDTATALATTLAAAPTGNVGYKTNAMLVSGTNFPDALAAAQLAGGATVYAIIPVTDPLPAAVSTWAAANQLTLAKIRAIGGTAAIPADVVTAVKTSATIAPLSGTIEALDGGTTFKVTFSGNVTEANAEATTSYSVVAPSGAVKALSSTAADHVYTAANALLGTPANVVMKLASGTLEPGDVVTVRGATIASSLDGNLYVAPVSTTVVADTTPVTAQIHAIATTVANGASKVWITFSANVKASTATGLVAADFTVTKGGGVVGGTLPKVENCARFGLTTTWECDITTADLAAGDTVTLKALKVSSTASTPTYNAAVSTTAVTDITKPVLTSVRYSMSATGGDQASLRVIGTGGTPAGSGASGANGVTATDGDVIIKAKAGTAAAGSAGNLYKLITDVDASLAVGSPTCTYTAATKTITVAVKDATETAPVVANTCNSDADFSALFVAEATTADAADYSLAAIADSTVAAGYALAGGKDKITFTATFSEPLLAAASGDFSVTGLTVDSLAITAATITNSDLLSGVLTLTGKTSETVVAGVDTMTVASTANTTDRAKNQVDATNPPATNVVPIYAAS